MLQISCLCEEEEDAAGKEGLNYDENYNVDAEYVLRPKVELNDEETNLPDHECVDCWKTNPNVEAHGSFLSKSNDLLKVPDDNEVIDKANTEIRGLESYTEQITFLTSFKMVNVSGGEDERPWHCLGCGKSFKRKHHCKQHMEGHLERLHMPCLNCSKVFCSMIALRIHVKLCKGKS